MTFEPLQLQNPWPWGHEFHNFCRGHVAYYNHANSLTAWCSGVKKKIFEDCTICALYMTFEPLQLQNPWPWGHEFHNFCRGHVAYYNHANSLTAWCSGVKKKIFEDCTNFDGFGPAPQAQGGLGPQNSQFMFPFTHSCYIPNLVEIGSALSEKKTKMFKC